MQRPSFKTLKDARAWLNEDAIADAVLPFRPFLSAAGLDDLVEYLETSIATHPELRKLATRAAKALVPPVVGGARVAARKDDEHEAIPLGPSAQVAAFEAGLVGKPDLDRPAFRAAALAVIKPLAKFVANRWRRNDVDDLVGQGWLVAVEITPAWDGTRSAFQTYLWRRVRNRLIDYAKRAYFRRERACGSAWADEVHSSQFSVTDPEGQFRAALNADATSYFMGMTTDPDDSPEQQVIRMCDHAAVRAARDALPERQRKLVTLIFFDDMPVGAAAVAAGVSSRTASRDLQEATEGMHTRLTAATNVRALRPQPRVEDDTKPEARAKPKKRSHLRIVKPKPPDEAED